MYGGRHCWAASGMHTHVHVHGLWEVSAWLLVRLGVECSSHINGLWSGQK